MCRTLLFLLLFVNATFFLHAKENLDSLENAINKSKDSKEKVDALNKLSWEYEFNEPEKGIAICTKALEIAKKLDYKKGIAQSLNDIGVCYTILGKPEKALHYYIESLKVKEQIGDERGVGISYINIGQVYSDQGQTDKALEYYRKALDQFIKINNQSEIAATYNSIGIVYHQLNSFDSARIYVEKALVIRKEINDISGLGECYGNLGAIYRKLGDIEKSIKFYELDKEYNEKHGSDYSATITMNNLSILYADQNDLDKAIATAKQSVEISSRKGYLENLNYALNNLSSFYYKKKDFALAYKYLVQHFTINDSLKNENLNRSLNEMNIKYETEKKDQENKLLQTQNDLSAKTIKEQRMQSYVIIGGLIAALVFIGFVVRSNLQKQKSNKIITQQKQEVEHKNHIIEEKQKEILDSIHYAKRIQNTLLAHHDFLNEYLPNNFVLFKPKDIVSGDFYWATSVSRKQVPVGSSSQLPTEDCQLFYLAVCDSTGHGVPGAFMSLLNIGFLSEAINEKNILEPNKIFDYVRDRLTSSVSKEGQKDGFDGILLCFELSSPGGAGRPESDGGGIVKITYAAAHNAPVLVSNNELIELPKDKMPVGVGERRDIFKMHTINVQKGDTLYLFTDGYADQFGGDKGKKFKYKALNELLLKNSTMPLKQQAFLLESAFETWKGNLEQVDDVCVIGIKF